MFNYLNKEVYRLLTISSSAGFHKMPSGVSLGELEVEFTCMALFFCHSALNLIRKALPVGEF